MILLPASKFSLHDLTDAYNQTRTDYLIPMPMSPARLQEYMTLYDVDLACSQVAVKDDSIIGLGMLGVRPGQTWITRLGVLPKGRRQGVGGAILNALLDESAKMGVPVIWLEVIQGNTPALELFLKAGFQPTRELIVARRPPHTARNVVALLTARKIKYLQHEEAIDLHCARTERVNWLNDVASMRNISRLAVTEMGTIADRALLDESAKLSGFSVEFQDGSQGWITYQATPLQLKRIIVEVNRGDPAHVTAYLLEMMHRLHAAQDAIVENIPDDSRWPGYQQAGYFETFRRIEMALHTRTGH